ncbi:14220_t:CDS:2, partial [Racocetra fulgida]
RSILDHDIKRITRSVSNHTDLPQPSSIILKQERVVSSMEIENSRQSVSEIRTVSNVHYFKDQDLNKQITDSVRHENGSGDDSYLDDTEEELEEEVAVGMAYMNSTTRIPIKAGESSTSPKEKDKPVITELSDDVMEGLMDSDTAVILDSLAPSENRGDVGDFVIGEFNDVENNQNVNENDLRVEETTGDREMARKESTANKLKYADDNTKTVLRSDSCASETNKLQERDEQSSGEATKIIDLNQKFREKIEMHLLMVQETPHETDTNISLDTDESLSAPP